jgi:hypothetical protein
MKQFCYITLCDPLDQSKQELLKFELFPIAIAARWKEKVLTAQKNNYMIDDPTRFYGFNELCQEKNKALNLINANIKTINQYRPIIDRELIDINDQDTLNYLHHIFEVYHGLLDKQNTEFWNNATVDVRAALANLNINVHRIESIQYGNTPRFVTTYFRLPKKDTLLDNDFNYLTNCFTFGGLYLNYVEIGKTLENLMRDNDQYIHQDAFKPWNYFSADFKVIFKDTNPIHAKNSITDCKNYFEKNKTFFSNQSYKSLTNQLKPGAISLGQLVYNESKDSIIEKIKKHQFVQSVNFED